MRRRLHLAALVLWKQNWKLPSFSGKSVQGAWVSGGYVLCRDMVNVSHSVALVFGQLVLSYNVNFIL